MLSDKNCKILCYLLAISIVAILSIAYYRGGKLFENYQYSGTTLCTKCTKQKDGTCSQDCGKKGSRRCTCSN